VGGAGAVVEAVEPVVLGALVEEAEAKALVLLSE